MSKILAISGGVGGAKLALGLSRKAAVGELVICANTADDFTHMGLRICPDLDTVMYTLAGLSNTELGWGVEGESWNCMAQLRTLGGEDWFQLGDKDLATHLLRSTMLAQGHSLTEVTALLCRRLGVACRLLPMSDQPVSTRVITSEGELAFQDYFVRRRCEPEVNGVRFDGLADATAQQDLLDLLAAPDLDAVIICPSNPFVSVAPVLGVPKLREALVNCSAPVVAVSPIVGGRALKGPAAKMMAELGMAVSTAEVARYYSPLLSGFVIDEGDKAQASLVESTGISCLVTGTVMQSIEDKERLAQDVLDFAHDLAQ